MLEFERHCLDLDQVLANVRTGTVHKTQIIATSSVLSAVSAERQAELADIARVIELPKGAIVFRQGDAVPGMYIVVSGLVRLYKLAATGKEHTLHLAAPTQTFAEVAAIAGFPCPAWAEAVEPTTVLLIPTEPFARMLRQDHSLCLELLMGMGAWVRHLTSLLEDIVLRDASARVARMLLASPRNGSQVCSLPGIRKHLASQLNLTAETLSRTLHRFVEAGYIALLENQQIQICDESALMSVSDGQ